MDILTVIGFFFLMSCLNGVIDLVCDYRQSRKK